MAFDLRTITNSTTNRAPKGIVYGPPGVGKTTFGACGLIINAENGIPQGLVVDHTEYFSEWLEMRKCLDWLGEMNHNYGVVTIDTVDWMLRRMEEFVSGTDGTTRGMTSTLNKSQGGYGNGKLVLRNHVYQYLLPLLDKLVNNGVAVLLLAHTTRRELTTQDGAIYEKSMPKIHADLSDVFIEWSDFVGAACMLSGERALILQETGQLVAKNRYGITNPISLSWDALVSAITSKV